MYPVFYLHRMLVSDYYTIVEPIQKYHHSMKVHALVDQNPPSVKPSIADKYLLRENSSNF